MAGDLQKPIIEMLDDERRNGYDIGFKAGIKEVVDWIEDNELTDYWPIVESEALEAQKKKWGIE